MSKSILHDKKEGTCYLCVLQNQDYALRTDLEEHHVMPGTANRRLSERYGLKVYLCRQHHREGPGAVHNNIQQQCFLQKKAQEAFETRHSHAEWMRIFGRDYTAF